MKLKKIHINSSVLKYVILPYFLIVVLHLVILGKIHVPWGVPDEFIYLAHARFFAGESHFYFREVPYANFGYGFFLMPIFWLADNPESIYRLAIVFNAFLLSTLYVIFFYIIKKIFLRSNKEATIFATLACFVPGIFVRGSMVRVENVFIPLFYLVILLFYLLLKKITYLRALFFAIAVILLLSVHARALPIFLVSLIMLLYLFYYYKYNRKILLAVVLLIFGFFVVNMLSSQIISLAWFKPSKLGFLSIFEPGMFWKQALLLISSIAGQILYLVLASFGLLFYALFYFFKKYALNFSKINQENRFFIIFVVLSCLLIFLSSVFIGVIQHDINVVRPDHYIFGRYNEVFLPLIILLGFIGLSKNTYLPKKIIIFFLLALLAVLIFGAGQVLLQDNYNQQAIVSYSLTMIHPLWGGVVAVVFTIIFFNIIIKNEYYKSIMLIFALFVINIMYFYNLVVIPNSKSTVFSERIIPTLQNNNIQDPYFDLNYFFDDKGCPNSLSWHWGRSYFLSQFYLTKTRVHVFDSAKNEQAHSETVIASCDWVGDNYFLQDKIIFDDKRPESGSNCLALWFKKDN